MDDITILYYTAHRIHENFAENVRQHLVSTIGATPIISITHRPLKFGHNICVGEQPYGAYSVYKQILIGALCAKTPYVACCEDDTLYSLEHFTHRPEDGVFAYNINMWHVWRNNFLHRVRCGMLTCIASTATMVANLGRRYATFPKREDLESMQVGEPGRKCAKLGFDPSPMDLFTTAVPIVHFNHHDSLGGSRGARPQDTIVDELPPWGRAKNLRAKFNLSYRQ